MISETRKLRLHVPVLLGAVWCIGSLWGATIPPSVGEPEQPSGKEGLLELENARATFLGEKAEADAANKRKLSELTEKHLKAAQRGRQSAEKRGRLDAALAWEELEKQLGEGAGDASTTKTEKDVPFADVEKARSDYSSERARIETDHGRKVKELRLKHGRIAERGKDAATKSGDLKLALAWKALEKELTPKLRNLATKASITASQDEKDLKCLTDGTGAISAEQGDQLRWDGGRPSWIRFHFDSSVSVAVIRFATPVGRAWHPNGHEPLDYEVLLKGGRPTKLVVRDGQHQRRELAADGKTQWVSIELKTPLPTTEVEFNCQKNSGPGQGPIIFEFQILGDD